MDQQWEQLRQRCLACRACSLAQERTQVVFGVGDPAAEVLLVGEAPGANEDKQGEPFVGRVWAMDLPMNTSSCPASKATLPSCSDIP